MIYTRPIFIMMVTIFLLLVPSVSIEAGEQNTDYSPRQGKVIMIEAGHGNGDPGAPSCDNQHWEGDVTIGVANYLAPILIANGHSVSIVRRFETSDFNGDAFVSLHNDYCPPGFVSGYKVSRYGGQPSTGIVGDGSQSDLLVQHLWSEYGAVTGLPLDTAPGHFTDGMLYYYALNPNHQYGIHQSTPGAIIEMGWWSGDEDALLNRQEELACGIASGILAFFGETADCDDGIVVDDGDVGFISSPNLVYTTSNWLTGAECPVSLDARWTQNLTNGPIEDWGKWTPTIPNTGMYEVFVRIPGVLTNQPDTGNAEYIIHASDGDHVVIIDQNNNYCNWISLGTFPFSAGTSGYVYLGDVTGEPYLSRTIIYDAVKFVPISPLAVDIVSQTVQSSVNWNTLIFTVLSSLLTMSSLIFRKTRRDR